MSDSPYRKYKDKNKMDAWYKNINWRMLLSFCIVAVVFGTTSGAAYWSCVSGNAYDLESRRLNLEATKEAKHGACIEMALPSSNKDEVRCPNKLHKLSWTGDNWGMCSCPERSSPEEK